MRETDRQRGQTIMARFVGACIYLYEHQHDAEARERRSEALADVRAYLVDGNSFGFGTMQDAASVGQALAQQYSGVDDTEMYLVANPQPGIFLLSFRRRERLPNVFLNGAYRDEFWKNVRSYMYRGEWATLLPAMDDFGWDSGYDRNNLRTLSLRVPAANFDLMNYALAELRASIRGDQMAWDIQLDDLRLAGEVGLSIYNTQEPI